MGRRRSRQGQLAWPCFQPAQVPLTAGAPCSPWTADAKYFGNGEGTVVQRDLLGCASGATATKGVPHPTPGGGGGDHSGRMAGGRARGSSQTSIPPCGTSTCGSHGGGGEAGRAASGTRSGHGVALPRGPLWPALFQEAWLQPRPVAKAGQPLAAKASKASQPLAAKASQPLAAKTMAAASPPSAGPPQS